jgi:hypothetical protein
MHFCRSDNKSAQMHVQQTAAIDVGYVKSACQGSRNFLISDEISV